MHTLINEKAGVLVNFNSDWSGDVRLRWKKDRKLPWEDAANLVTVEMPAPAFLGIAHSVLGRHVQDIVTTHMENAFDEISDMIAPGRDGEDDDDDRGE